MKGITGTIGAGKSLVGRILRDRKIRVIDADVAVHHLYRDNESLRAAIVSEFGEEMLTEKGISRSRMADLVFSDPTARKRLEALVYPALTQYLLHANPAFVEAALFENVPELVKHLDEIWVVCAARDVRKSRLIANRGFSEEDAERRIELQSAKDNEEEWTRLFPNKKLRFIDNSGDEAQLQDAIKNLI
jgi:dephospho-CoA kinase